MTTLALTVADSELAISGVRFTKTGLLFEGEPNEAVVTNVGRALSAMRSVSEWCEADYLPQMVRLHLGRSARKRKPDAEAEQIEMRVITEYAGLSGRDAAQLHERDKVGRFFPADMRKASLSFAHHVEAWLACGDDRTKALEWLEIAEAEKLSVSEFRAYIRRLARAASGGADAGGDDDVSHDPDIAHINLAAARLRAQLRAIEPQEAARRLRDMASVVALVHELEARAELK